MREKLKGLGIDLPILPTTSVGSFPKPDYLLEGRRDFAKGKIQEKELKRLEERATVFWLDKQNELGIDVFVDGEMYRGDMVEYFAQQMDGFIIGGLVRSYGNRYYHKPIIVSEVKWRKPITVGWWKFAQSHSNKPVKGMLTGPYTMMDWSFNEKYETREEACIALSKEIRKEVESLIDAGAKIIQIDEPATSARPQELSIAIEAMHNVIDGLPAYFISHICYGAFETIYPEMLRSPVDNFDLEMSNSNLDFLRLIEKYPFTKDMSFGVVDVHSHIVEDKNTVAERIRSAFKLIPKDKLWIDPDCGLKTRTIEEAIGKLKVIVEATAEVRKELSL